MLRRKGCSRGREQEDKRQRGRGPGSPAGSCGRRWGEPERPASMEGSLAQMSQGQSGEEGGIGPVTEPPTEDEEPHLSLEKMLDLPGGTAPTASWDATVRARASGQATSPHCQAPTLVLLENREQGLCPVLARGTVVHRDSRQSPGEARSSKSRGPTKPHMPTGPSEQGALFQERATPEQDNSPLKSKSSLIVKLK